jgi:ketosteroid isomerase-like protein
MKTLSVLFAVFTLFLIAACNPKPVSSNELKVADSLLKASDEVYNTKDPQKIADLYSDDALIITPDKNYWTKDSIFVLFKMMAPMVTSYKSYLGPATISEDIVQFQKYYTIEFTMGQTNGTAKGVGFQIWKKQPDKTWKIVMFSESIAIKPF